MPSLSTPLLRAYRSSLSLWLTRLIAPCRQFGTSRWECDGFHDHSARGFHRQAVTTPDHLAPKGITDRSIDQSWEPDAPASPATASKYRARLGSGTDRR